MPKLRKDHTNTRCCICGGRNTSKNFSGYPLWLNHICDRENCTKYICKKCWLLDINSDTGKGLIIEMTVAKVRKLKNNNLELDNFNAKFDLSYDQ